MEETTSGEEKTAREQKITKAQQIIEKEGSKLGIVRAIKELGLDEEISIPESSWLYAGKDIGTLRAWFEKAYKPVIVRGCHPNDLHGYIDVLPTTRNVHSFSDLEKAIRDIWQVAASDDLRIHSEDWGQPFTGTADVLVQEQWGSPDDNTTVSDVVATMIKHPHLKDMFIIQGYDKRTLAMTRRECGYDSYTIAGRQVIVLEKSINGKDYITIDSVITKRDAREAVNVYHALEDAGILDKKWSYQLEMQFRPFALFQARPFKKIEPVQEFNVRELCADGIPYLKAFPSYGITPKEGIRLGFTIETGFNWLNHDLENFSDEFGDYGVVLIDSLKIKASTRNRYGKLMAFALGNHNAGSYLYHNNYRFIKKAKISMIVKSFEGITKEMLKIIGNREFRESIVVSNGDESVIIPAKYI